MIFNKPMNAASKLQAKPKSHQWYEIIPVQKKN